MQWNYVCWLYRVVLGKTHILCKDHAIILTNLTKQEVDELYNLPDNKIQTIQCTSWGDFQVRKTVKK